VSQLTHNLTLAILRFDQLRWHFSGGVEMLLRIVAIVLLAGTCGGCASVVRGTTDQIQILSEPSGAEARTSLGQACVTPCLLQVSKRDGFGVHFSKAGYHPEVVIVGTRLTPEGTAGFVGNVLIGGAVGMGVDAATGATRDHYPNPVFARLDPMARRSRAAPDS
jgi:hypothetical protein